VLSRRGFVSTYDENTLFFCTHLNLCMQLHIHINEDNLNNIRRETSRHFRNKKTEYTKEKIVALATNNKHNNIRDLYRRINGFRRGLRYV
jgi:hypothetical protein